MGMLPENNAPVHRHPDGARPRCIMAWVLTGTPAAAVDAGLYDYVVGSILIGITPSPPSDVSEQVKYPAPVHETASGRRTG